MESVIELEQGIDVLVDDELVELVAAFDGTVWSAVVVEYREEELEMGEVLCPLGSALFKL